MKEFHKIMEEMAGDSLLLPELRRVRVAAELQAALLAHAFFRVQDNQAATDRLAPIIQQLTAELCNGIES